MSEITARIIVYDNTSVCDLDVYEGEAVFAVVEDISPDQANRLAARINDYEAVKADMETWKTSSEGWENGCLKMKAQRDEAVRLLRQAREKIAPVSPLWRLIGELLATVDKESKDAKS